MGSSMGPSLATGFPFLSITNLVKFHFMPEPRSPPCFSFKNFHSGWASAPLTLTFSNMSNLTPKPAANCLISVLEPGSWNPNWLQGKARMANLLSVWKNLFA